MKKWFKTKVNEIGEKAVDSMVNLIFSKNETPMNNFNPTPIINAITRSVNSKVVVKQANTEVYEPNLEKYPPICDFELLVTEGIFLLVSDGNMAHTKYFANVNKQTAPLTSSAAIHAREHATDPANSTNDIPSMGSIRHNMIVDEKKNKIAFDNVGSVKPNFCKYWLEVEIDNTTDASPKKSMLEDFNRVVFDYRFTGKVYNTNTDVFIALWCELDIHRELPEAHEELAPKKPLQPRKISSVQCPSIYAPRVSINSQKAESSAASDGNGSATRDFVSPQPSIDGDNMERDHHQDENPKAPSEASDVSSDAPPVTHNKKHLPTTEYNDGEIEKMILGYDEPARETPEPDKNNYSRKLGRAVLSVPLILASFKPEGALDVHEDIKFLFKYAREVMSINARPASDPHTYNPHTSDARCGKQDGAASGGAGSKDDPKSEGGRKHRYKIRSCFWLQLFPFNENKDTKFIRPYCGFPLAGMRNPVDSIGFLLVAVELGFNINPTLLPIVNNLVPPGQHWVVPSNFEMYHFSAITERLTIFVLNMPIWVTRLLLGGNQVVFNTGYIDTQVRAEMGRLPKEKAAAETAYTVHTVQLDGVDLLFIVPFWFLLYELFVRAPLWKMPLILYLILVLIIVYYYVIMNRFTAFGDRINALRSLQPHGLIAEYVGVGRTKYKSCSMFNGNAKALHRPEALSSSRSTNSLTSAASSSPRTLRTVSSRTSISSTPSANDVTFRPRSRSVSVEKMAKLKAQSDPKRENEPADKKPETPRRERKKRTDKTNARTQTRDDKFNNSLFENHLYKRFRLLNRMGVLANDSIVATAFGDYKLNFMGLGEEHPIFSDDMGDFDIKQFVQMILVCVKYLQAGLGHLCVALEKLRFSTDTGFYQTTVMALVMMLLTLGPLSLVLRLLSRVSTRTLRLGVFVLLAAKCLKSHLKVMVADVAHFWNRVTRGSFGKGGGRLMGWLRDCAAAAGRQVKDYYRHGFMGLPDHREVDHRKICALQNLPSLCQLLPKDYAVDWRALRRQFRSHYKTLSGDGKPEGIDLMAYAKSKSLIERTVLEAYLANEIPAPLSVD